MKSQISSKWLHTSAVKIALIYAVFGVLWILCSDQVLAWLYQTPEEITKVQTYKGWFFIVVTATLVYLLVQSNLIRIHRSNKATEEIRERLELALRGADLGLWDWHIQSGHVVFDERWGSMLGYQSNELKPQFDTWKQLLHPDDTETALKTLQDHLDGVSPRYDIEFRLKAKDGFWKWIHSRGRIVERDSEGQPLRIAGTHLDITKQKQAILERMRLAAAIEQAAEIILLADTSGKIIYVNHAFEKVAGYHRDEIIGKNYREVQIDLMQEEVVKEIEKSIAEKNCWSGRITTRKNDPNSIKIDATFSPIQDESGKTVSYVGIGRDITKQIEMESQLRQSQKMEAVGQLAGGIAHDFNNLLHAIKGYVDLAVDSLTENHPGRYDLKLAQDSAERATTLVRQLLTFSRQSPPKSINLDINQTLSNLINILQRVLGKHIEIGLQQSPNIRIIKGDPGQIEQIVMNLCVNARDAMPEGGKITIKTQNWVSDGIFCTTHPNAILGEYILLSVSDSGHGIPNEDLQRIFEPFFTTKEEDRGTGLGLATVYSIVQQHQGIIDVKSQINQGTTFNIFLPVNPSPQMEEQDNQPTTHT